MASGSTIRPRLLMEYVPRASTRDVPDPYYTGRFDEAYDLVAQGCQALLDHIVRAEGLLAAR